MRGGGAHSKSAIVKQFGGAGCKSLRAPGSD